MKYKDEVARKRSIFLLLSLKNLIKKVFFIIIAIVMIIGILVTVNFFRDVVFGQSTLNEFRNNFYGLPAQKLIRINRHVESRYNDLKKWIDGLSERLSL